MKKEDRIVKTEDKKSDAFHHLRKILYVWSQRKFFSYESNLDRNIMNKKIKIMKTDDDDNQYNEDWWWW